jgi:hypothetical protein
MEFYHSLFGISSDVYLVGLSLDVILLTNKARDIKQNLPLGGNVYVLSIIISSLTTSLDHLGSLQSWVFLF